MSNLNLELLERIAKYLKVAFEYDEGPNVFGYHHNAAADTLQEVEAIIKELKEKPIERK